MAGWTDGVEEAGATCSSHVYWPVNEETASVRMESALSLPALCLTGFNKENARKESLLRKREPGQNVLSGGC